MFIRPRRCYSVNYYQILQVPANASIKEIKLQFKKLSKKFHPDLNNHLSDEDKIQNNEKYLSMVNAYDTLKDVKKKKQYDLELRSNGNGTANVYGSSHSKREWQNKYYGEAKYYSKSGQQSYSSGYRYKPHDPTSHFSGTHRNYGDRFDVPHFDYNLHLHKHLQFERRIIDKSLSKQDQLKILSNLEKSGIKLTDETITKYLLRHIRHTPQSFASESSSPMSQNPHMYYSRKDDDESSFLSKFLFISGASGGMYLLYNAIKD